MTDKQKKWIAWGAIAVLIAVMGFLGINFPVQVPPTPSAQQAPLATLAPGAFVRMGNLQVQQLRVTDNEEHSSSIETHSGTETHSGSVTISTITAPVVRYGSTTANKMVCGTTNVTSTVLSHGLSTPSYAELTLAQDATGDCNYLSYTNSAAVITAKCWNSALTPAAATTPAAVSWCVVGTP